MPAAPFASSGRDRARKLLEQVCRDAIIGRFDRLRWAALQFQHFGRVHMRTPA